MHTHVLRLVVLVESLSQPLLFKYYNNIILNINCIYHRCHLRLRETLIFKSLLLVYSLLKLSLLTYHLLLALLLLLLLPGYYIPLYCRTSVHALFVLYTRLPLVITARLVYISYLLSACYVDSYDAIIMHLSQLHVISVNK